MDPCVIEGTIENIAAFEDSESLEPSVLKRAKSWGRQVRCRTSIRNTGNQTDISIERFAPIFSGAKNDLRYISASDAGGSKLEPARIVVNTRVAVRDIKDDFTNILEAEGNHAKLSQRKVILCNK
jgi:hypothetical protein